MEVPINVKSKLGHGSQFYIDLPICKSEDDICVIDETVRIDEVAVVSVLVVDDEESVLISMELLLQSWGYTVLVAFNVNDAINQYRLHQPQIIITDYHWMTIEQVWRY
ncbi:response regulator [Psychrobacter phenylpyruvicus]|uniref:Histidine kinase n=1 Tax=Psychrobacter phenylpyruvicus TaxID=29432 RepID=A0A379LS46_9GAMM|nr:response regulator [Psychrobacter phenylpyruvicus]SUD98858.1 histidine kinase [Psychrobacter phenylpyruvicus]